MPQLVYTEHDADLIGKYFTTPLLNGPLKGLIDPTYQEDFSIYVSKYNAIDYHYITDIQMGIKKPVSYEDVKNLPPLIIDGCEIFAFKLKCIKSPCKIFCQFDFENNKPILYVAYGENINFDNEVNKLSIQKEDIECEKLNYFYKKFYLRFYKDSLHVKGLFKTVFFQQMFKYLKIQSV